MRGLLNTRSAFWRRKYLQRMLAKRSRAAVLQSRWEGEVCRSGEGMWESAGNGGMCDVSSCTTLIVCHNSPLLRSWCLYIYLQLNVIQQATLCVHTRISVLIFTSAAMSTIFQSVQRAQRRKTATLQVRLRVLWCV